MTHRTIAFGLVALLIAAQPAAAARLGIHDAAESPQYGRKAGGMLGRGALNAVTCFVDPVVNIVNETKAGPPLVGTLTGIGKGLGCGILRLGSGAVDIVTFWVPGFNGFPVSTSYENCLATEARAAADTNWTTSGSEPLPASTWEVPTTEPGAAQAPVTEEPKKKWSK